MVDLVDFCAVDWTVERLEIKSVPVLVVPKV